jgi:hypothetical protein
LPRIYADDADKKEIYVFLIRVFRVDPRLVVSSSLCVCGVSGVKIAVL